MALHIIFRWEHQLATISSSIDLGVVVHMAFLSWLCFVAVLQWTSVGSTCVDMWTWGHEWFHTVRGYSDHSIHCLLFLWSPCQGFYELIICIRCESRTSIMDSQCLSPNDEAGRSLEHSFRSSLVLRCQHAGKHSLSLSHDLYTYMTGHYGNSILKGTYYIPESNEWDLNNSCNAHKAFFSSRWKFVA